MSIMYTPLKMEMAFTAEMPQFYVQIATKENTLRS